ncbi:MAG: DNA polymerase III subunit gamma/tau [Alphaproteobacteria bacterium GM7ARS4]|nr:DNA polymerase III subunit gamma/tau [Alphaproteobacteria bacterium GM7ARS4]
MVSDKQTTGKTEAVSQGAVSQGEGASLFSSSQGSQGDEGLRLADKEQSSVRHDDGRSHGVQAASSMRLALARRYRPARFEDVLGQDVTVRILRHALSSQRLGHALLFAGPRGTGKTTLARLVARAVNCTSLKEEEKPCGRCASCLAAQEGRHFDILEIDAASHTGVDMMRDVIEQVPYHPVQGTFKFCIIDEVHMLSKAAFNALLKTLEEPPPHAFFLFATTEASKIPLTVLSRCQRFDLNRLTSEDIVKHIEEIGVKEGFTLDGGASVLIARHAQGSMRDALSLLDAALAGVHDGVVRGDALRAMIGVADGEDIIALLENLFKGNVEDVLQHIRALYHQGSDAHALLSSLLDGCYWLTILTIDRQAEPPFPLGDSAKKRAQDIVEHVKRGKMMRLWQMVMAGYNDIRLAPNPLHALEIVLLRVMHGLYLPTLDAMIDTMSLDGAQDKSHADGDKTTHERQHETQKGVSSREEQTPALLEKAQAVFPDAVVTRHGT